MATPPLTKGDFERIGSGLLGLYVQAFILYLIAVWALWTLGVEAIYQHPTPFYALYFPAFPSFVVPGALMVAAVTAYILWRRLEGPVSSLWWLGMGIVVAVAASALGRAFVRDVREDSLVASVSENWSMIRWHVLALGLVSVALILGAKAVTKWQLFDERKVDRRALTWILLALVVFAFVFPASIAMIRDGSHGISQSYERQAYEYVGDIGKGLSIRGFIQDYNEIHAYLSMHSKVHPPGPVVILWLLSLLVGQGPLALSLASMALGALAIIPLYFWVRDMLGHRVALCTALLYTLMPSIVLFTATSADITFTPITITTLFLFWRAMHRGSWLCGFAAGILYGALSFISFSLVGVGAFFGIAALWRLSHRQMLRPVLQTALVMITGVIAFHGTMYLWTGFDIVECFELSRAQFDLDQKNLDIFAPRFPAWSWRIANPACIFFFAGIPVSILFLRRILRPSNDAKSLFWVFSLTLVVFDILYLARGEAERSAMYVLPFVAVPAAHFLDEVCRRSGSLRPVAVTILFLAAQCWFVESYFYTYW